MLLRGFPHSLHRSETCARNVKSPAAVKITAQRDLSALDKLVEMPSPLGSLFTDMREAINDTLHPRTIETTVDPVEVEEIWSKPKAGFPRLMSVGVHVCHTRACNGPMGHSGNIAEGK